MNIRCSTVNTFLNLNSLNLNTAADIISGNSVTERSFGCI